MTTYRYNEIVLGLMALVWAAVLLLPDDMFATLRRFDALKYLAPDWVLGVFMLIPAVSIIYHSPVRVRCFMHLFLFGIWLFVGYLTVAGGFRAVTVLVGMPYVAAAFLHVGEFWHLRQEIIA